MKVFEILIEDPIFINTKPKYPNRGVKIDFGSPLYEYTLENYTRMPGFSSIALSKNYKSWIGSTVKIANKEYGKMKKPPHWLIKFFSGEDAHGLDAKEILSKRFVVLGQKKQNQTKAISSLFVINEIGTNRVLVIPGQDLRLESHSDDVIPYVQRTLTGTCVCANCKKEFNLSMPKPEGWTPPPTSWERRKAKKAGTPLPKKSQTGRRTHRNHCPYCLHSVHIENSKGKRNIVCGGIYEPIGKAPARDKGDDRIQIVFKCKKCGTISRVVKADDDNQKKYDALPEGTVDFKNTLFTPK